MNAEHDSNLPPNDTTVSLSIVKAKELQKFSENAAKLLLERKGEPEAFFRSLAYEVERTEKGYKGTCPACFSSTCFIGLHGKFHVLYWKCQDEECPSRNGESNLVANLLGLVRGIVKEKTVGKAIEVISTYLGYKGRSFHITNGKATLEEVPPPF